MTSAIIDFCLVSSFIISVVILFYSIKLSKKLGSKGFLHETVFYISITSLILGIHYLSKLFFFDKWYELLIVESLEAAAAILIVIAVYNFYKIVKEA